MVKIFSEQSERLSLEASGAGVYGGAYIRDKVTIPEWYQTTEAIGLIVLTCAILLAVSVAAVFAKKKVKNA